MKKLLTLFWVMLMCLLTCGLVACGNETDPAKPAYWFDGYKKTVVEYQDDGESDNIETAGTYWEFKAKKDYGGGLVYVRITELDMYSSVSMTINGVQCYVEDTNEGAFQKCILFTDLKKGDEVKIHAKWTNSVWANDPNRVPFEMTLFGFWLNDGSNTINYITLS